MSANAPIEVILWDIDGTLLMGKGLGRESFKRAMLRVFGTAASIDTHHFGGKTDWFTLRELLMPLGFSADDIAARMTDYAEAVSDEMSQIVPQFNIKVMPQAVETVTAIRNRTDVLQGIVTGNVYQNVAVKLGAAGFDPAWFPFGAYGHESYERNDLPPLALARAEAIAGRTIPPERVLIVGDTLRDVWAAQAMNAQVCAVLTGHATHHQLEAANPTYLIPDLTQFFDVVPLLEG